jgi:hypothetical protein
MFGQPHSSQHLPHSQLSNSAMTFRQLLLLLILLSRLLLPL